MQQARAMRRVAALSGPVAEVLPLRPSGKL
jgi:hypothetical protein